MKRTWIKNARIVNEGKIFHGSIVIENEVIAEVLAEETVPSQPCGEIIDAKGYYLMPGVIDDHVHFRDPGLTHKADIHTESTAAAAGWRHQFYGHAQHHSANYDPGSFECQVCGCGNQKHRKLFILFRSNQYECGCTPHTR